MCDVTGPFVATISLDLQAPGAVRRMVGRAACPSHGGLTGAVGAAALLASELVTDALLHGQSLCELRVECQDGGLRISVTGAGLLEDSEQGSFRELRMLLVERLSSSWGVEWSERGPRVWCVVPAQAAATGTGHAVAL